MSKIYSIASLLLLVLVIGVNYGIFKYYDADKVTFNQNIETKFNGDAWGGFVFP